MKLLDELRRLSRTTEESLPLLSPCVWPLVIVGGVLALAIAIPVVACLGVGAALILGLVGGVAFTVYVFRIALERVVGYFMWPGVVSKGEDLEAAEGKGDDKVVVTQEDRGEPEQKHNDKVANTPPQARELGQNMDSTAGITRPHINELGQKEDSTLDITRPNINELGQKENGAVRGPQPGVHELGQRDGDTLEDIKRDIGELGQKDDIKAGSSQLHMD